MFANKQIDVSSELTGGMYYEYTYEGIGKYASFKRADKGTDFFCFNISSEGSIVYDLYSVGNSYTDHIPV